MTPKKPVTIIGLGAVGSALAMALHQAGYPVKNLYSRKPGQKSKLASRFKNKLKKYQPGRDIPLGDIIFICVSDDAIRTVAEQLYSSCDLTQKIVVHCSGTLGSNILNIGTSENYYSAAFHPVKSFSRPVETHPFEHIYIDIEGSEAAVEALSALAGSIGAIPLKIDPPAKPYLHMASVLVSNYMVTLAGLASKIGQEGGLKPAEIQKALIPLMKSTIANLEISGTKGALTGPVARGDIETIKNHLKKLEQLPDVLLLYKKLGVETVKLAKYSGRLSEIKSKELLTLFDE